MTTEPLWISKKALLLLHEESLATFGGVPGVRDQVLLDAALARPQNTHACNPHATLADLAAPYALRLARNPPFVDGNKRAAFLSIGLFLALNGLRLTADKLDAIYTTRAVAAGELDEPRLGDWIRANSAPIDVR